MRIKYEESTQLIHIDPNTTLTSTRINQVLISAKGCNSYAKFYTDKYFIQVNFMKDNTINVSTNIRLSQCIQDLWRKNKIGWNIDLAGQFVYQWMTVYRKLLS